MRQPQSPITSGGSTLLSATPSRRHEDDRDLLAAGLPADIEALVAGGGDLGQVDRDAAELDAGGEALDEAADDDDERRERSRSSHSRAQGRSSHGANRHQRQRQQQPGAAAVIGRDRRRARSLPAGA